MIQRNKYQKPQNSSRYFHGIFSFLLKFSLRPQWHKVLISLKVLGLSTCNNLWTDHTELFCSKEQGTFQNFHYHNPEHKHMGEARGLILLMRKFLGLSPSGQIRSKSSQHAPEDGDFSSLARRDSLKFGVYVKTLTNVIGTVL